MTKRLTHRGIRWVLVAASVVALVLAGMEMSEAETSEDAAASESEPAVVEHVAGTSLSRLRLSASAAERLGLETAQVGAQGGRRVVPYSALLYDERGRTWVYTSPEQLTFVRAPVTVGSIRGDLAILSAGPPVGTLVASVGAAELFGTEFEVDH